MKEIQLKVGIAGYGVVGKRRRACVDRHPQLSLVAVCDRAFSDEGVMDDGLLYYSSYQQLLQEDLDILIVCLTNEIAPEPVITEKQEVVEEPKEVVESLPEEPIQTQFYNDTKWMRMEMENVISNETFTIESLKGQKVIVELYSEQCYPCGEQKVKLQEFIEENNNSFKHISLNVDPISKKKDVIKLIDLHQYDWPFVLSSKELRVSIIKKFSSKAVRYDLAPLLLVCEDLSAHLLAGGIKGKHQLNIALKKCD